MSPCATMWGSMLVLLLAVGSLYLGSMLLEYVKTFSRKFRPPSLKILIPIPALALILLWTMTVVESESKPCHAAAKSRIEIPF